MTAVVNMFEGGLMPSSDVEIEKIYGGTVYDKTRRSYGLPNNLQKVKWSHTNIGANGVESICSKDTVKMDFWS